MKKLSFICLILILSLGSFTTCKKDNGVAPALPPAESLTIDFSNFSSMKKSDSFLPDLKGTNNSFWEFAASVAIQWKSIITTTLAVPVASFKLAVDQDPVFLSNKTWQWSYSVSPADVTYKARLTGQISSSDIIWTMYITAEGTGGFPEFVWFTGKSKVDGTSGQWIFNQSSTVPEALLQIDWTKSGSSVGDVKYTYVKNNDSKKTSYIEYGLITGPRNAFYNIHYYDGTEFSDVNVEWNTTTFDGRVKCSTYLLGSWYCWDSNKINLDTCPS
jgi:hypothetical protein